MEQSILNFAKQFEWQPKVINNEKIREFKQMIVCGMGGSHLATGILKTIKPGIDIYTHRNYDLPPYDLEFLNQSLLVASSYSGNTEETISFLEKGISQGYQVAVVTTGGKLLEIAKEKELPYIEIPKGDVEPRMALGYSVLALARLWNDEGLLAGLTSLSEKLDPTPLKEIGENLAEEIDSKIPLIYSSADNLAIAYNWKINLNETGKIPTFYNVFPELNHNEMTGFDAPDLPKKFHTIFLLDSQDHPRIKERMEITADLYQKQGMTISKIELGETAPAEKVFESLLLAFWTSLEVARNIGADPKDSSTVEKFKANLPRHDGMS